MTSLVDKRKDFLVEYCRIFDTYDPNGTGSVPVENAFTMCLALGVRLTQDEIQPLIDKANYGDKSSLTRVEFILLMAKCRARQTRSEEDDTAQKHILALQAVDYVSPDSVLRWIADLFALITAMYYVVVVTLEDVRQHWFEGQHMVGGEVILSAVLVINIMLNMVTPDPGEMEAEPLKKIMIAYWKNPLYGLCDTLSALPWHFCAPEGNVRFWLRHLRLLKIICLRRFFRSSVNTPKHTVHFVYAKAFVVSKLKDSCVLVLALHGFCVLWLLLKPESDYLQALSLVLNTVLTIGLGDVAVRTPWERVYMGFLCVVGAFINGFIISKLGSININSSRWRDDKMLVLIDLMKEFRIPVALQAEISNMRTYLDTTDANSKNKRAVHALPAKLRDTILLQSKVLAISKSLALQSLCNGAQQAMARAMTQTCFSPFEFIICAGEFGSEVHILSYGVVNVFDFRGQHIRTAGPGHHFGTDILEHSSAHQYSTTVKALTYSVTMNVTRSDFLQISEAYPEISASFGLGTGNCTMVKTNVMSFKEFMRHKLHCTHSFIDTFNDTDSINTEDTRVNELSDQQRSAHYLYHFELHLLHFHEEYVALLKELQTNLKVLKDRIDEKHVSPLASPKNSSFGVRRKSKYSEEMYSFPSNN